MTDILLTIIGLLIGGMFICFIPLTIWCYRYDILQIVRCIKEEIHGRRKNIK